MKSTVSVKVTALSSTSLLSHLNYAASQKTLHFTASNIYLVFRKSSVPSSSQIIPISCDFLGILAHYSPCSPFWSQCCFYSNKHCASGSISFLGPTHVNSLRLVIFLKQFDDGTVWVDVFGLLKRKNVINDIRGYIKWPGKGQGTSYKWTQRWKANGIRGKILVCLHPRASVCLF